MKNIQAIFILAVVIGLGVLAYAHRGDTYNNPPTRCTEDMACWNCHTMGNRICGTGR